MTDESQPDHVEDPKPDQDQQALAGTGNEEQDDLDTAREMETIVPSSVDELDSATIPGVEPGQDRIVLEGDAVPGYDLLGELGRGGMGVVYKARDQKLKRIVALKMILSGTHASDEDMQRFQTEAEAVARLQHPNIVQIFEVAEHEGRPYIALEFADGGSLDQKIAGTPQNAAESAQLVETLARAMQQAHDNEIIHRDLKPANILLTADGEPRITDFGLAKRLDEDSSQTKSGAVMGTPSYMAPEQAASNSATLGPAADTYALGAILYHMLTGRPPFQAETQLDTIMQVISEEPLAPRKLNSSLPVDLETICLKCLEKDVHRRYESAEALAEDLRRFGAGEPIQARPVSAITRTLKWARRRPAVAGMIGISAAALVALVAGGLWYNAQLVDERDIATQQTKVARQQTQLAKAREHEAEQARAKEEEQRKLTEQQRTRAEEREREANQARRRAEKAEVEVRESEREARQSAYIADMQLLSQDWENKRLDHLKERLARHADEEGLLGFEWHYWNQL
ncbi:MAG: serine/threonine-protein kinase, partial [Planctomycetota bacterium]|nr:serine/threonine-protein kinase [Planctomycetota bacterium]